MGHEALRNIDGLIAHEGQEVVVDSDLADEEDRTRRDLALLCYIIIQQNDDVIRNLGCVV